MATATVSNATQLIQKIIEFNANGQASNTIKLRPGPYNLSEYDATRAANNSLFLTPGVGSEINGLPVITSRLTIQGTTNDPTQHVITRDGAQFYRLAYISLNNGNLTLKYVTLQKGDVGANDTGGGALVNKGTLTANTCIFTENRGRYGGAVTNAGTMTLTFCTFTLSVGRVSGTGAGGAVYNGQGSVTIRDSVIKANEANDGGAFINFGTLLVERCLLSGNSAVYGGAVGSYGGTATVRNSALWGNRGNGGGLYSRGLGLIKATYNALYDNQVGSDFGVLNDSPNNVLDARFNWWGHPNGPQGNDVSEPGGAVSGVDVRNALCYAGIGTRTSTTVVAKYQRPAAAQQAINLSRSNFDSFPSDYPANGSDTRLSLGAPGTFHGSVGSGRNYSRILDHRPRLTGSSIFVSEAIFGGGLPMTVDADDVGATSEIGTCCDDEDACPDAPIDVIGTFVEKGWRYCPADRNGWTYGSAKPNWRDHDGIKLYFANDVSYLTIDASFNGIVESSVNFDNRRGTNKAGTLEAGGRATLSALFDGVDVRVGDYIFVELTNGVQASDHGFLIVGWGQVPDNLLSALNFTPSFERSASNPIPYVADFCFGAAEGSAATSQNTGWLQDPRPRPFYASAVEIYADQLRAYGYTDTQLDKFRDGFFQPFLPNPNQPRTRPNWQFYRIPDTQVVPLNRIYCP